MQNGRFPSKIALHLKKVCYKVSFCEYYKDNVVRHSLAYLWVNKILSYRRETALQRAL